ncbi:hypothetical protein [Streptomyces sp. NBC_01669]|nr:hypothetical protein [Streptomyces sp. NBC_01669]MCX4538217.1 hypothetical protein [Streptomyces sp. NBC_01669]
MEILGAQAGDGIIGGRGSQRPETAFIELGEFALVVVLLRH